MENPLMERRRVKMLLLLICVCIVPLAAGEDLVSLDNDALLALSKLQLDTRHMERTERCDAFEAKLRELVGERDISRRGLFLGAIEALWARSAARNNKSPALKLLEECQDTDPEAAAATSELEPDEEKEAAAAADEKQRQLEAAKARLRELEAENENLRAQFEELAQRLQSRQEELERLKEYTKAKEAQEEARRSRQEEETKEREAREKLERAEWEERVRSEEFAKICSSMKCCSRHHHAGFR